MEVKGNGLLSEVVKQENTRSKPCKTGKYKIKTLKSNPACEGFHAGSPF